MAHRRRVCRRRSRFENKDRDGYLPPELLLALPPKPKPVDWLLALLLLLLLLPKPKPLPPKDMMTVCEASRARSCLLDWQGAVCGRRAGANGVEKVEVRMDEVRARVNRAIELHGKTRQGVVLSRSVCRVKRKKECLEAWACAVEVRDGRERRFNSTTPTGMSLPFLALRHVTCSYRLHHGQSCLLQ